MPDLVFIKIYICITIVYFLFLGLHFYDCTLTDAYCFVF